MLARGASDDELRMLGEYGIDDCGYRRTLRLPDRMLTAAAIDRLFVFTHETPAPTLMGLRPRYR